MGCDDSGKLLFSQLILTLANETLHNEHKLLARQAETARNRRFWCALLVIDGAE